VKGMEFEQEVLKLLKAMGFEGTVTSATRDGGIDIVAYSSQPLIQGTYIVQCKDWSNPVGEPVLRDLYGTMMSKGANKGILVTSGNFTEDAIRFATGKPLELIDGAGFARLCKQYGLILGESRSCKISAVPPGMLRYIGFKLGVQKLTELDKDDLEFDKSFIGQIGEVTFNDRKFSFSSEGGFRVRALGPNNHSITATKIDVKPEEIQFGKKNPDPGNAIVGIKLERNYMHTDEKQPFSIWEFFEGEPQTVALTFRDAQKIMGSHQAHKQCFVATAVYKDCDCEQVILLRQWRDSVLQGNLLGRWFIRQYYRYGYKLASGLSRSLFLQVVARTILDFFVRLIAKQGDCSKALRR